MTKHWTIPNMSAETPAPRGKDAKWAVNAIALTSTDVHWLSLKCADNKDIYSHFLMI